MQSKDGATEFVCFHSLDGIAEYVNILFSSPLKTLELTTSHFCLKSGLRITPLVEAGSCLLWKCTNLVS